MTDVISREKATEEVDSYLNHKKISQRRREGDLKNAIESLIDSICEGTLVLKENFVFEQKLKFPPEGLDFQTLEYKPRVPVKTIHLSLQGVKSDDADKRVAAYIAAITSKSKAQITSLDTDDYSVGQNFALFFI